MRITFQSQTRNYLSRMNNNLGNLSKSNQRMADGRKFMQGNENVIDAGKALKIRKLIEDDERYLATIRDATGRAEAAEDNVRTINSLLNVANDKLIYGMNGVMSQSDRELLADEVKTAQEEILQIMNAQYSDKYLFAASGNKNGQEPFTVSDGTALDLNNNVIPAGALMYNGTPVDNMTADPVTGKPTYSGTPIQYNKDNFVDIGFGYNVEGNSVDPNTGFKDTFSGAEVFGFGMQDGVPLNAYSLLGKIVDDLKNDNYTEMGKDLSAIPQTMDYLLKTITEIGSRGTTLENTKERLDKEHINLLEVQNELEYVDYSEEAINNKGYEMSWMVTLQLGSKILPSSIFEFLR